MDDIMVSVCCVAYNHEKYVKKAIESILNQKTNFKFEVLVHDDASLDSTADIIREYEEKYPDIIKPIYQTVNQYSMNIPITNKYQFPRAKGKYIAFCECDDYWTDENKLQKQVNFLEKNKQYIACVHRYIVVDEYNNKQNVKTFGYYEKNSVYKFNDFFEKNLPSQIGTLLMRNIAMDKKKGYPEWLEGIKIPGDIKLNLWLLVHGDIYRMDDVMSAYRFISKKNGQSYSSRIRTKAINYTYWCQLQELENLMKKEYGLDVYFEQRRMEFALGVIKDLQKAINITYLKNAICVILKQRGMIQVLSKEFLRVIKK